MTCRCLPTLEDVLDAVRRVGPATVGEVHSAVGVPWEQRGTIRNRVLDLVECGALIADDGRPMRVAVNCHGAGDPFAAGPAPIPTAAPDPIVVVTRSEVTR